MKTFVVLSAMYLVAVSGSSDLTLWAEFKAKHLKNYSLLEEETRFLAFQQNLRKIEQHNAKYEKGELSYFLTTTQFADWTEEEVKEFLTPPPFRLPSVNKIQHKPLADNYPTSFDWRDKGAVSDIPDQGKCKAGWAFAAVGAEEGRYAAAKHKLIPLSAEEILDCGEYENYHCKDGSYSEYAYYEIQAGLSSAEQYPYTAYNGETSTCYSENITNKPIESWGNFGTTAQTEDAIVGFIAEWSPISTHVNVIDDWLLYGGGVYDNPECSNSLKSLNHGILAVGYGVDEKEGKEYFILKNTWGKKWGEDGFIRVVRNKKQCGISIRASFPILWDD